MTLLCLVESICRIQGLWSPHSLQMQTIRHCIIGPQVLYFGLVLCKTVALPRSRRPVRAEINVALLFLLCLTYYCFQTCDL